MSNRRRKGSPKSKALAHEERERLARRYAGPVTRAKLLRLHGYRCSYCGRRVTNKTANIDHIVPWKRGGTTRMSNLIPSCWNCNKLKGNMSLVDFAFGFGSFYDARLMRKLEGQVRWLRECAVIDEAKQLLGWLPWPSIGTGN